MGRRREAQPDAGKITAIRNRYIGDRHFYERALLIAVPMILQNLITNFVSMLDNIMVGQIGTAQMSGVSIANQFIFVFNMAVFGGVSGASIFGTQFYGKGDPKGQRYTYRFRLYLTIGLTVIFAAVFLGLDDQLVTLFLSADDDPALVASTLGYGKEYLRIMVISLLPFAVGQAYASTIRECGETRVPMIASFAAVGVNLVLDYALIFGKFGFPCLGVAGAAIATIAAKVIETAYMIVWTHTHLDRIPCMRGAYQSLRIPLDLTGRMFVKGVPLLINEFLWSLGMSVVAQSYSVRGIDVVAARNIASVLVNLFNVVFVQMGGCTGIIVGTFLGADNQKEAVDSARKMTVFSLGLTVITALLMLPLSFWFPEIYNTETEIRRMATFYLLVQIPAMPIWSYTNSCYFILRSGGKTLITFLFDAIYTWFIMIPLAFVLTHYTAMDIHLVMVIVTYSELIKVFVGYFMVRSGIWKQNLVSV